jgi:hypothetical protein
MIWVLGTDMNFNKKREAQKAPLFFLSSINKLQARMAFWPEYLSY